MRVYLKHLEQYVVRSEVLYKGLSLLLLYSKTSINQNV